MASKFIRIKRLAIPVMILIILSMLASQLWKHTVMDSKEMVNMINAGDAITIELAQPSYNIEVKGTQQDNIQWIQLDQLQSFNKGFRQGFDELFNINIVTENGINGKSGCLYVDEAGDRNGNTTLEDTLRNKVFVTKYWGDVKVKDKLATLASEAYTDVDGNTSYGIAGAINAYYNLLQDAANPSSFNPTQSLTREEFYALVFKTEEGVRKLDVDKSFEDSIGGKTNLSIYAQEVDEYGFLSVTNKSLDGNSYRGSISRAEAVYMIVNKHFSDKYDATTGKEQAYSDTKNAGDLALKAGFKTENKETKEIVAKDRWQSYTLAYMMQNPDKGMQEDLYKAMVVAKGVGLIGGEESRWDEPISKSEAIMLVTNAHLIKNKHYGYLSEAEHGKMDPNKLTIQQEDSDLVIGGYNEDGLAYGEDWAQAPKGVLKPDPNEILSSGLTMAEAREVIDKLPGILRGKGASESEIQDRLEFAAKDMGSDLETILSLDVDNVEQVVEKPVEKPAEKPVEKPVNNGNKGNAGSNTGSGGSNKGNSGTTTKPSKPAVDRELTAQEEWDAMPDWQKEFTVAPGSLSVPDLEGVENPFVVD